MMNSANSIEKTVNFQDRCVVHVSRCVWYMFPPSPLLNVVNLSGFQYTPSVSFIKACQQRSRC